ncbi:MAG: hypothetical protein CVU88_00175 [Firmicutes bacterium HGW-Firmicutes-13]|nr:MAG: hypothetical protein CVU88_00175 [Firmicutes bacterium HGW-Firmicutes-13]
MEPYRKNLLVKELIEKIEKLSQDMEKFNLAEYLQLINNPRRFLWINFLSGLFRGLGIALGASFLAAVFLYLIQRMVVLNLPLIGDFIAEIVKIVQNEL